MDINLSLEHYETFYRTAQSAHELAHYSPKCAKSVDELQQRCRICGCLDDGSFVELDAVQDFEFESSICSYRVLLQRTSLQFQFHTMPDLPSRICIRCGYKAKIFYLMTRQFVLGQHAMRSTITEWYHKRYGVEAPEQIEDRTRLMKQLAMAEADSDKKRKETSIKEKSAVKELIKACEKERIPDFKRSVSADNRLEAGGSANNQSDPEADTSATLKGSQLARSTVNLRCPPKSRSPTVKTTKGNQMQVQNPQKPHQSQTARADMLKIGVGEKPIREKTVIIKSAEHRECPVTPRLAKIEARGGDRLLGKAHSNRKILEATAAEVPTKPEVPPSKAQLQQKLQERRRQWR